MTAFLMRLPSTSVPLTLSRSRIVMAVSETSILGVFPGQVRIRDCQFRVGSSDPVASAAQGKNRPSTRAAVHGQQQGSGSIRPGRGLARIRRPSTRTAPLTRGTSPTVMASSARPFTVARAFRTRGQPHGRVRRPGSRAAPGRSVPRPHRSAPPLGCGPKCSAGSPGGPPFVGAT